MYVAEYKGIQILMFGTTPFEESYNKDYKGVKADEQLELVKKAVNYDMPTLMVSHFPISSWKRRGDERHEDFMRFLCRFAHVTYLDGHTHHKAISAHDCVNDKHEIYEYTAPYRSEQNGWDRGAWALLVSPQDGVLQTKFVSVNERVNGDGDACKPNGERCLPGTTCRDCCLDSNGEKKSGYWWGKLHHACGKEPLWGTGTRCLAGTSCKQCRDGYNWWWSKFGHHCGKEPCWNKGKVCGAGTTCKLCCKVPKVPWFQFGIGKCD